MQLNVDGRSKDNPGYAGSGGLIPDSLGTWVRGFSINIRFSTFIRVELWTVITELERAWSMAISKLIIESDSTLTVDLITKNSGDSLCELHVIKKAKRRGDFTVILDIDYFRL